MVIIMIEFLNGTQETVPYRDMHGIRVMYNSIPQDFPAHWHSAMEIIMPVRSEYGLKTNGETISFHPGDIVLIPPGELHALFAPPEGERYIIQFDYSLISGYAGLDSLLHILRPYRKISPKTDPQLAPMLTSLLYRTAEVYGSDDPFREPEVYSLMLHFLAILGRSDVADVSRFPDISPSKQQEYIEKFMGICDYINEHCTENLNVDLLAHQAGFSKYHFSRLFKQFTGISCYDYLIGRRIALAEKLLLSPDLSITDVAMQAGFNSLSTFNRVFKTQKGCTPSSYKSLNRGILMES